MGACCEQVFSFRICLQFFGFLNDDSTTISVCFELYNLEVLCVLIFVCSMFSATLPFKNPPFFLFSKAFTNPGLSWEERSLAMGDFPDPSLMKEKLETRLCLFELRLLEFVGRGLVVQRGALDGFLQSWRIQFSSSGFRLFWGGLVDLLVVFCKKLGVLVIGSWLLPRKGGYGWVICWFKAKVARLGASNQDASSLRRRKSPCNGVM